MGFHDHQLIIWQVDGLPPTNIMRVVGLESIVVVHLCFAGKDRGRRGTQRHLLPTDLPVLQEWHQLADMPEKIRPKLFLNEQGVGQ